MKKILYIDITSAIHNHDVKHYHYEIIFRGKHYPVYPVDSLLVHKKLDDKEEIYMFFDNGKIKHLGKVGDFQLEYSPYCISYEKKREQARQLAIDWQLNFANKSSSWLYCIEWANRFECIGRKYGLLREFRENGII